MTVTNEQIQALKAAAESVIQAYGDDWFETGSQICTLLKSKVNLIAAANPAAILALLAERDADKALIAEQAKRIAELEASLKNLRESMAAIHNTIRLDGAGVSLSVLLSASKRAYEESAAAGITLVVGE